MNQEGIFLLLQTKEDNLFCLGIQTIFQENCLQEKATKADRERSGRFTLEQTGLDLV